jgi:hypothetical protein
MRTLSIFVTAIGLVASSLAWAEPLAPGKPAGTHSAQLGGKEYLVFGGIAALGLGIVIATSGGRSSPGNNQLPVVATAT